MNKTLLTMTASAFLLATTMGIAQAQTSSDDTTQQGQGQGMMGQGMMGQGQGMMGQRERMGGKNYRKGRERHADMMRRHHRGGSYGMHHGMGGMGGMGHRGMMQILFAIMDANGDDSLSLEEVQEIHARIFAHVDENDDGQVTKAEIRDFFRGGKKGRRDARSGMSDDSSAAETDTDDDDDNLNLSDEVGEDDDSGSDN
jgi:hypothetical protein